MTTFITVHANNVDYRHEESEFPLFEKNIVRREDDSVEIIEYLAVKPTPEMMNVIRDGIDGFNNQGWYHLLVRHGVAGKCGYYPVPLLFSSEQRRNKIAADRGTEPPRKAWVEQKRELIRNTYLCEDKKEKSIVGTLLMMIENLSAFAGFRAKNPA